MLGVLFSVKIVLQLVLWVLPLEKLWLWLEVFFYHETPNFNHNFHLYLIFNLDFRIILILLQTIYLYNTYAAELSFTFFAGGSIILLIKKNSFIMYLDVGFGQPLEEEVCLQIFNQQASQARLVAPGAAKLSAPGETKFVAPGTEEDSLLYPPYPHGM